MCCKLAKRLQRLVEARSLFSHWTRKLLKLSKFTAPKKKQLFEWSLKPVVRSQHCTNFTQVMFQGWMPFIRTRFYLHRPAEKPHLRTLLTGIFHKIPIQFALHFIHRSKGRDNAVATILHWASYLPWVCTTFNEEDLPTVH
jgi:hypothetical protein